jgi:uncharacterized protein YecE (DUF72 family)
MTNTEKATLRAGTSGLVLPVPNKLSFPEPFRAGSRLTYYASLFNSIEVNSTFYKLPMPATFTKWAAEVPEDFQFTVKLSRDITHQKDFHFTPIEVNRFMHAANHIGAKKGCLLIQLPPSTHAIRIGQLEKLLERVLQADPDHTWRTAVEFRHRSWYKPEVDELLAHYRAGRVLQDMPDSRTMTPAGNTSFVYLRFHGPAGDYKGGYDEVSLLTYAHRVDTWLNEGKPVYVYFNNTIGDAIANLTTLRSSISSNHSITSAEG